MLIEKMLLDYLNSALSVPAYMEKRGDMPPSFVLIERTGSSETNRIYQAVFVIQSYAPSLYQAAMLNEDVKNAMRKMISLPEISAADLESDYEWTDTQTKSYRYQALYSLTVFNE